MKRKDEKDFSENVSYYGCLLLLILFAIGAGYSIVKPLFFLLETLQQ